MDYDEENPDGGDDAFGDFGNDEDNDIDGEQQDEAALLANFSVPIQVDYKNALEMTIKKIGKATISKIVHAQKESGTDHFSKAEKEAVLKLFD